MSTNSESVIDPVSNDGQKAEDLVEEKDLRKDEHDNDLSLEENDKHLEENDKDVEKKDKDLDDVKKDLNLDDEKKDLEKNDQDLSKDDTKKDETEPTCDIADAEKTTSCSGDNHTKVDENAATDVIAKDCAIDESEKKDTSQDTDAKDESQTTDEKTVNQETSTNPAGPSTPSSKSKTGKPAAGHKGNASYGKGVRNRSADKKAVRGEATSYAVQQISHVLKTRSDEALDSEMRKLKIETNSKTDLLHSYSNFFNQMHSLLTTVLDTFEKDDKFDAEWRTTLDSITKSQTESEPALTEALNSRHTTQEVANQVRSPSASPANNGQGYNRNRVSRMQRKTQWRQRTRSSNATSGTKQEPSHIHSDPITDSQKTPPPDTQTMRSATTTATTDKDPDSKPKSDVHNRTVAGRHQLDDRRRRGRGAGLAPTMSGRKWWTPNQQPQRMSYYGPQQGRGYYQNYYTRNGGHTNHGRNDYSNHADHNYGQFYVHSQSNDHMNRPSLDKSKSQKDAHIKPKTSSHATGSNGDDSEAQTIREILRIAATVPDVLSAVAKAEQQKLTYEAYLGRRKLEKLRAVPEIDA